ncbi:MAG: rod shape-determining protein RodA [Candidatus Yonathbacteria bacterium RIFOXYC1_FULL_52_10]|uniref:Rod shape-determining protein RodA n=1 Tax=Candidatus Yonathbacteria bacterium RIFOXYD1_FULL_52_36 TaxID=1802730 RepID=A0A1G2SJ70_9BACT|nr:MAG: rod shape-determining protein RodA [Candidatus Yonathbacteria bacterium RIFOXYD1_FULL_52_36]OHA85687.1 MAG: rod shape-determining protein RodA [Candidatus Yonathbacteria bacterium RIFOXYC1_FULL_52_10]
MEFITKATRTHIDWILFLATLPLLGAGLLTMDSFAGENPFFVRQLIWIGVSLAAFFAVSFLDMRFLKRTGVLVWLFVGACAVLLALFVLGHTAKGATSWFDLGGFSFQPSDPVKLLVILILAKYFSRRHVEIAHFRHIILSGVYALIPFLLVFLQPDFGSAMIIFFIWFGMIMVSGISRKHLLMVFTAGALIFAGLWAFVFADYQKARIATFINPLADIRGTGWNAYQSTIAVGSGELLGKGVGYGTQSRLKFLPEYQTDFVFAAFAEEWGFVGVVLLFTLFGIVMWRILANALVGAGNFETLFGLGLAIFLMAHFTINVGMNMGLMPVTGITAPFLSYGGSHLLTEFIGLGILMSFRRYARAAHRDDMKNEFLGV